MKSLKVFALAGIRLVLAAILALPLISGFASPALAADEASGTVYTLSNSASGNAVLAYSRATDGSLSFQGAYDTGGLGSGAGLGSQSAVAISMNNQWLFAVNAGSDQVSIYAVQPAGLTLVDTVASGGAHPVSLTNYQNLLYVLNAGGSGNITGFSVSRLGKLTPISGSTQPLSNGGAGAAPGVGQIAFTPDGQTLVVTEKSTNLIDTYTVENWRAGAPVSHTSSGVTPFGFDISRTGTLIVSEAFGGAPGASALSSYRVNAGEFEVRSPSVPTTQTAACWVVISKNGRYAYTTNAGSGTISSYRVGRYGRIALLNAAAGSTGAGSSPIDMAISNDGVFLYALSANAHTISMFQIGADGSLTSLGSLDVPAGSLGLASK